MSNPRITIITPSFNQGQFLEETILSIINQGYDNLEYIVIDGGSTDNSVEIIKKYKSQINYWISEKDSGQSDAINKGFSKATGDVITWINSDDVLLPGALEIVSDWYINSTINEGLIYGATLLFDEKGDKEKVVGFTDSIFERSLAGIAFPQPASFFKTTYLHKVGFLDLSLHYGMDYDLFARLALVCNFTFIDFTFSKYRLHNSSKSMAEGFKFLEDWTKVFFKVLCTFNLEMEKNYLLDLKIGKPEYFVPFNIHNLVTKELSKTQVENLMFFFCVRYLDNIYGNSEYNKAMKLFNAFKLRFNLSEMASQRNMKNAVWRLNNLPVPIIKLSKYFLNYYRSFSK
jgi:glycosyltransferase involved in cell wall biosynthesis